MTQSNVIYGVQLAAPCPLCNVDCLGHLDMVEDSDEFTCDNCGASLSTGIKIEVQ